MQRLLRTTMSLPLAGLITMSLAGLMAYLISVEGEPGPAITEIEYELFPRVAVIDLPPPDDIEPVDAVDPPPPPPAIDVETASRPDDDLAVIVGNIPDYRDPVIDNGPTSIHVENRLETPVVRIPPVYPAREAERGVEGLCTVHFDLNTNGQPFNVRAGQCDSSGFARASVDAVRRWRYEPRIMEGRAVERQNMTVVLDFNLDG